MSSELRRVGLIVPSSNTTMETEIPDMLRRRELTLPERFTFHSARVRMLHVTEEELAQMVSDSGRCAVELADAHVDVIAYACLVAVMAQGPGRHEQIESELAATAAQAGCGAPVVSSAGALVRGLRALGISRVAMIAPYVEQLTALVVDYLRGADIEVVDAVSLEISDNRAVAALDPTGLQQIAQRLDLRDAEAVILSACVQLRSLRAIPIVEAMLGLPVLSAATATTYEILDRLGLDPCVPDAGALLSGVASATAAQ